MWLGVFACCVGTWMQTVVLGAYAYRLTQSSAVVGALTFAQIGPLLLLSIVGGIVADAVDRHRLLAFLQAEQLVFSLLLAAVVATSDNHSRVLIFSAVGRVLVTLAIFAVLCLPFVGLFPAIAEKDLGLASDSISYEVLYAAFGLGACLGALSIGTVLVPASKMRLVPGGLVGFAVLLAAFGALRLTAPAYLVVFVLGLLYFGTTASMLTVLQTLLTDEVHGRVMALWFMAFGGGVSVAVLAFGPLLDASNGTVVLGVGAAVALLLAWWCDLPRVARGAMVAEV
jgi:hypothetical protein